MKGHVYYAHFYVKNGNGGAGGNGGTGASGENATNIKTVKGDIIVMNYLNYLR